MRRSTVLRTTGIILLTLGAVAAVGALVVRDQIDRHQRDLFSPQPLKRFAALGYIAGLAASVEMIRVLRDFIAWEPRTMLRSRARQIMDRMERQLLEHGGIAIPHPGIAGMKALDSIGFLGAEDVRQLDALLVAYLRDTEARLVALADRSGRLLTSVGDMGDIDPAAFASLVAGDFAASGQLASQVGEAEFASLYHKGPDRSMFLADVGGTAILAVLFDDRTTLGLVRVKAKTLVPRGAAVFEQLRTRGPLGELVQFEAGWAAEAEHEVDRVFRDS